MTGDGACLGLRGGRIVRPLFTAALWLGVLGYASIDTAAEFPVT